MKGDQMGSRAAYQNPPELPLSNRTWLSTTVASLMGVWPSPGQVRSGRESMSVAVWSGSLVAWERELAALKERIGPVFGRAETRETAGAFLDGLLSGVARKTGWLLAEQAGLERPYRMQSLLGRSRW